MVERPSGYVERSVKTLERGVGTFEAILVGARMLIGVTAAFTLSGTSHSLSRPGTMAQLVGLMDAAHARAAANGSTVTVAAATDGTNGSIVTYYDGYGGGNVVQALETSEPVGVECVGGSCTSGSIMKTATLLIRRDGSCDLSSSGTNEVGASSINQRASQLGN